MARMTRMTRMAHTVARMARWLADLADPQYLRGTPTLRPENSVNIWSLLWLSYFGYLGD